MRTQFSKRTTMLLAGGLSLGFAVLGAGCAQQPESSNQGYVSGDGTTTILSVEERGEPIEMSGVTLTGEELSVADYRGSVVVINVWGSWCPPCRAEAPALAEAWKQLEPQGVKMMGVNFRDSDVTPALAFEKTYGITYPSLHDPDGQTLVGVRGFASVNSLPTTLVLDEEGRVAARVSSEVTTQTVLDLVEEARLEPVAASS